MFGGVATSIILGASLAQRTNLNLRIVTQVEPTQGNVQEILKNAGISYDRNVEFCCSFPGSKREVDVAESDFFLTTSWWSTYATRQVARSEKIIYLLQEDERQFYPAGDDQLLCQETLRDPNIQIVVNTKLRWDHFKSEGFTDIERSGLWFNPAFPSE